MGRDRAVPHHGAMTDTTTVAPRHAAAPTLRHRRSAADTPPAPDAPPASEGLSVSGLVEATPASRDRYVDFLRALSIVVVVLWHWVFSITQWSDEGSLIMPNPIG